MSEPLTRDQIRDRVRRAIGQRLNVQTFVRESNQPLLHPSHERFRLSEDAEDSDSCLIEPAVNCIDCGFCQSYGH